MRLIIILSLIFSTSAFSEDVRHLHFDKNKSDRSEIYKRILGKDYTTANTQTERALEDTFGDIVVIDRVDFLIEPLPASVRLFASNALEFKEVIDLLSVTYGFKPHYIDLPKEVLEKSVKINTETHNLSEVLAYLEMISGTSITVWPIGTGSTIMVTM